MAIAAAGGGLGEALTFAVNSRPASIADSKLLHIPFHLNCHKS
jgi:hypothetical protein